VQNNCRSFYLTSSPYGEICAAILDHLNIPTYRIDEKDSQILISSISDNGIVKVNNIVRPMDGTGRRLCTFFYNSNNVVSTLSITSDILLERVSKNLDGSCLYAFSGVGTISKNGVNIASSSSNEVLTLIKLDKLNNVMWNRNIITPNLNTHEFDITSGAEGVFYLGLTFDQAIRIDALNVNSRGQKDILLAKITSDGGFLTQHFGSTDNENIKGLTESNGVIFIGGEINGTVEERKIGHFHFLKWSDNIQNAYVSYTLDEDFVNETPESKQASKQNFISKIS
jgi:hypothetical protein